MLLNQLSANNNHPLYHDPLIYLSHSVSANEAFELVWTCIFR